MPDNKRRVLPRRGSDKAIMKVGRRSSTTETGLHALRAAFWTLFDQNFDKSGQFQRGSGRQIACVTAGALVSDSCRFCTKITSASAGSARRRSVFFGIRRRLVGMVIVTQMAALGLAGLDRCRRQNLLAVKLHGTTRLAVTARRACSISWRYNKRGTGQMTKKQANNRLGQAVK